jgi:hypothetical protein
VAGAGAVADVLAQHRPLDRLSAGPTRHGGGVQQSDLVAPRRRREGQVAQSLAQLGGETAQALVGAGLLGQVGEQVPQAAPGGSQPAVLGGAAEQDLGDGEGGQLGVGEPGWAARAGALGQQVVDGDVQCDDEVVETGAHEASLEVDVASATPTLGGLVLLVTPDHAPKHSESFI